jgi:DNA-binding MarR family transcriptional regulator
MAPPPLVVLSPLHRAMRQVALYLEAALHGLPVQGTEGHLLSFLARYSPASCGELTRVFGVKPSTLTSLLDRLVARDLVTREVDANDRRSVLVAPTAEGRRLARRIDRNVRAFEGRLRARVSEAELRGFQAVMDAIAAETAIEVRAPRPRTPLED